MPGLDPATDLEIDVEENVLQITGERSDSREVKETDRYITERRFGAFQRCVMLPEGADPSAISATYDNGVLAVRIPLPEAPEMGGRRKVHIDVVAGSDS